MPHTRFLVVTGAALATLLLSIAAPRAAHAGGQAAPSSPASTGAAATTTTAPAANKTKASPAKSWIADVNAKLKDLYVESSRAEWIKNTYITEDTESLSAEAAEKVMGYTTQVIKEAAKYSGQSVDEETARALLLLRLSADLPSPSDAKKTEELAGIASKMTGLYGKGKYCKAAKSGKEECRDLEVLTKVMSESRNYDELLDAWQGWHTVSPPMRTMYQRYVELANEGAKEIGFNDVSTLWRSRYDMKPEEFEGTMEKLWTQVKPLYEDLHCYVRGRLAQTYKGKVDEKGYIPAHLLGNMWAQEWANIYPLIEPYKGQSNLDVTAALKKKKYDHMKMVQLGEGFFTSLGLKPLPKSFYERSMFLKPKDRDVVCHASAWDVTFANDVRIKMCIEPNEDNLITIHHELGHIYYYQYYYEKPVLFQQGAHDGFHEAIGDAIALSITPKYLVDVGIFDKLPAENEKATINLQMKDALDKIAFLPFGLLMDKWRWDVFNGKTPPTKYNESWWNLRKKYQGIAPGVERTEADFDPGAKYHIPANVPYARYFLARVVQFQLHRALCDAAGHKGPLYTCSIYGNKEAGARMQKLLEMGASRPWQDAMQAVTGQREMDATAILDYFAPLATWLKDQNKGKTCGWPQNSTTTSTWTTTALVLFAVSCLGAAEGAMPPMPVKERAPKTERTPLSILSTKIADGGEIPERHTCEGEDLSPPLAFSHPPPGTKSLALVVDDPDAPDPRKPKRTWVHWVVVDLPADTEALPEGIAMGALPKGASFGINDWKKAAWGGPCPPVGRHRYFFKLYALDVVLAPAAPPTKAALEDAMSGHVLAEAQLVATYEKHR